MASICPHSTYLPSEIACSHRTNLAVSNLKLGYDDSFSERKLGFSNSLCFLKLENRRGREFQNAAVSRLIVLTISCEGSHELDSTFEMARGLSQNRAETVSNTAKNHAEQQIFTEAVGGDNNDNGDSGRFENGGGGDDQGGDDDHAEEEKEFGRLLNSDEVASQVQAQNVSLPSDMADYARTAGMRSIILSRFIDLQAAKWPLGAAIRCSRAFRNRMLADQNFLFKILIEIAIDSGCATVAEVQKRGDDFWNEFELYMADLVVGVVVDVALVSMLAPVIQFQRPTSATGFMAGYSRAIQSLPNSVFEAATPGRTFSIQQRLASYFYKGIQYGAVGFSCGIIGQGIANSIMLLKRKMKKSDSDVPVPPLVKSAALWGVFLAVSSNTRYQVVNGLERVVEGSALARRLPVIAMAFTICIRFANNTYGGMQFVDWARWSGVQ
ncbi:hypothetical protein L7F22_022640 [Adiantum nelumboides]|nr:hypothetical protein [Adiantum nelumboides]